MPGREAARANAFNQEAHSATSRALKIGWISPSDEFPRELATSFDVEVFAAANSIDFERCLGIFVPLLNQSDLPRLQEVLTLRGRSSCAVLAYTNDIHLAAQWIRQLDVPCDDLVPREYLRDLAELKLHSLARYRERETHVRERLKQAEQAFWSEAEKRRRHQRAMQLHTATISVLSGSRAIAEGNLEEAISQAGAAVCEGLNVEHSTVWIYTPDYRRVRCVGRFRNGERIACLGDELSDVDFPNYFAALEASRVCGINDTTKDERGRELGEGRGPEPPVRAFLASGFYVRGQKIGVLRADDLKQPRDWTLEEENFLASVADLLALAFEVRERRSTEDALRQSEQKLRLVLENAREFAFLLLDDNGRIQECSSGAELMLGYSEGEMIGQPGALIFTEEDRQAGVPEMEIIRTRNEGPTPDERWHRRKDGTHFWASGFTYPLRDSAGATHGFVKIMRDVTERKLMEQRIKAQNDLLEERVNERTRQLQTANEQMEGFCYTVSHDLRAPLRSMESFSTVLLEDYSSQLDAEGRDLLQRIRASAQRMDTLINDLLDYSRVARAPILQEAVSLDDIVHDALRDLDTFLREHHAEVSIEQPLPIVCGSRPVLLHVMTNLLSNAAKFAKTNNPPRIKVFTSRQGEWQKVFVQDNGIGIAPEHQERIFRIFERLHQTHEFPGTGVGLAIVQKSIERLGGRAGVESIPGAGSTFWFELKSPRAI
jgi:PAS domain S-box-containing protein